MKTTATGPILPSPESPGADPAPCDIQVVHSVTATGDTLCVRLTGEIDHFSAAPLRVMLAAAATGGGRTRLVVDASRVTFADTAFLHALEAWSGHGRRLRIDSPSRPVQLLLRASRALDDRPASGPVPHRRTP
ncbi:STAS domain-containing protein [Streptomyces sp. NPDC051211]|uniref:STAS domain-containing protein n=1 Tax=Streptomyces sp. NPDC051211 TaxID=3154643 RepID=UPI00344BA39E